ncbi:hypothetical protein ABZ566_26130, partial [Streptomyces hygroscopicus]|uniref:hypothetical protein n=1 Tax=Streptomyces hygroscopicus TaxID=1912 RepID=UPI0033F22E9E
MVNVRFPRRAVVAAHAARSSRGAGATPGAVVGLMERLGPEGTGLPSSPGPALPEPTRDRGLVLEAASEDPYREVPVRIV